MTSDVQLAWRNLWRNRRRTLLSSGGIMFASAILVIVFSFQVSQYQLMLRAAVDCGTGYLQAHADGYQDDPRVWLVIDDPGKVADALRSEPRVVAVVKRSEGFALLASDEHALGGLVIGIEPGADEAVTTVAQTLSAGAFLAPDDFDAAVMGSLLARNLGVDVGGVVTVLGTARDGSVAAGQVVIKGLFESGQAEIDRSTVYVPFAFFDEVFRMEGAAHRVVARADGLWWLQDIATRLTSAFAGDGVNGHPPVVMTWRQLLPGLLDAIKLDMSIAATMYGVLVLVVAFSILNTFIMAVYERKREFGVMMAIGTTPGRLVRVLALESAFLTLVGIVFGVIVGSIVTAWLAHVGLYLGDDAAEYMAQYGLPERIRPELSSLSVTIGPGLVFLITMGAALVPALRIRRLRPVEAMRAA